MNVPELPVAEGWHETTLGQVATVVGGGTPDTKNGANFCLDGGIPWLTPADLSAFSGLYISRGARNLTEGGLAGSSARLLPAGTVLMSSRAPIGYVAIAANPIATNQGFKSFLLPKHIEPRFLLYWLKLVRPLLEDMGSGSTFAELSGAKAREIPFRLAPLAEQRRIVEKVELLLGRVIAARERLERVPQLVKRFRQAVLTAACRGRLTEGWRESGRLSDVDAVLTALHNLHAPFDTGARGNAALPNEEAHDLEVATLPQEWRVCELLWLCTPGRPITYGILKPGPDTEGGIPYVRVADFPNDQLRLGGIRRTSPAIAAMYRRSTLRTGDILLSIRGTFGRVCRVPPELDGANITQDTARLSIHPSIAAEYIEWFLRAPGTQARLRRASKGVAVKGVNIGDVRALQIALPPHEEQLEIVRRVQALFSLADTIERRTRDVLARVERMPQAILSRAFAGELVTTEAELARTERRSYETAGELLARIRAEHEVRTAVGKRKAAQVRGERGHAVER